MSSWDKCTRGGKFIANYAKTQRTDENLKKVERPNKNELATCSKTSDEIGASNTSAYTKDEFIAPIKNVKKEEEKIIQLSFVEHGFNNYLLKWLDSVGFSSPNRVQNEVLYRLSERRFKHTIIEAPKKSGKTSAALLWVLNQLLCDIEKDKLYPKALMICPTFEIATTTYEFFEQIPAYCELKIYLVVKGTKLSKGEQATADLVIATPDKALELSKSDINLKNAKYLIFDDAHCLSDAIGHLKTISLVCSSLSHRCRVILCTFHCNQVLDDFIEKFLMENRRIQIKNALENKKVIPKEIFIVHSSNEERVKAFISLEKSNYYKGQTVVFCKTKEESTRLKISLDDERISVETLNGNLKPNKRKHILQQFKENKIKLLITTYTFWEVLEAVNVTKVINYEQALNSECKLDPEIYGQIEDMLNGKKNCLIASFIEQKWEDVLIQPKPGSKEALVYANAKTVSASDLINGQNFDK